MSGTSISIAAAVLALSWAGTAAADDWERCTVLSFAPLDDNVPACERVLAGDGLSGAERAQAHAARADALGFAFTYHLGHEIDREAMLETMRADLDAAVALDPAWHAARADLRMMLGDWAGARDDYTAAIAVDPSGAAAYLGFRSLAFENMGALDDAIADVGAALRLDLARPDIGHLMRRGQLYEVTGDLAAAERDYRAVLAAAPGYPPAQERLEAIAQ
jgi:tetratricopeptide (TPR) repeat protein